MKQKARKLTEIADEIRSKIQTIGDIIAIGGLLFEAKNGPELEHGEFLPWLEREFDFSDRTAQNYMKAHEFALKYEMVSYLKLTPTALYFLSESSIYHTPQAIALVLAEAAEKRVTEARAETILYDEFERTRPKKDEALAALVREEEESGRRALAAEQAQAEAEAEAEAILDGPPPELPPEPPSPPPQQTQREQGELATFRDAIAKLKRLSTKPVAMFKGAVPENDLATIVDFLIMIAEASQTRH
jgi:Protein of unknown function (DUF3102)